MMEDYMKEFKKKGSELIMENSGWGEHVLHHDKELETSLSDIISMEREREIELF